MSVLCNRLYKNFTDIPNGLIEDASLPCAARILYALLLVDDGKKTLDRDEIVKNLRLSGLDELEQLLQKLVSSGWLKREFKENGTFVCEAVLERKKGEA